MSTTNRLKSDKDAMVIRLIIHLGCRAGKSIASAQSTAFAEEFRYDDEDRQDPWIKFIFKVSWKRDLCHLGM